MSPKDQSDKNNAMSPRRTEGGAGDDDAEIFGGGGILEGGDYGGAGRSPLMEIKVFAPVPQQTWAAANDGKDGSYSGAGTAEGGDYGGAGGTLPILEITVYTPSYAGTSVRTKPTEVRRIAKTQKRGTQL